ncbi:hypothetical protein Slin15195_G024550 [Septoria linicola]|uniref:Uncharacterized protein n=1 Tax=Septoria linicola TaxID=215465 RepID=A0A9Q9AQV6_9PEZI|nr:hypothetical protein Slin14017_G023640 [Septoria linicola]USW49136.1 hypothetical protein Slin15195_G024550 [Septoria linicola]
MAPKKNDRPVVATRRSGRIASRAGSVVSSTQEETKSGLYRPIPQSITLSTLHSRGVDAVNSVAGQRVAIGSNSRVTKNIKSKSVTSTIARVTRGKGKSTQLSNALVPAFDIQRAIWRILMDRNHIQTLTESEKEVVIAAFADREEHFKKKVNDAEMRTRELEAELANALKETKRLKEKTKTPMRDGMFQQSLKKRREQAMASSNTPSTSRALTSTTFQSPLVASDNTFTNDSIDFSTANLITGTPAPTRETPPQNTDENATPKSRTSIFGSFFKTITTPFFSRSKSQEGSTPQQSPQESLGELPASHKRPASAQAAPNTYTQPQPRLQAQAPQSSTPAPAQQTERERQTETRSTPRASATSSAQKTARAFTVPSSKNPLQETSLATITEHTESCEQSIIGAPTPSRAPRSIAAVRRAQQTPSRMSATPTRVWSQQPPPRDTNADRRLGKLRKFQELNEELEAMKKDEEIQQITERPLKRVKIDHLVKIPARRPGESSGTFRMFDVDSDDEMEVDADEAVRSNIFEVSATEDSSVNAASKNAASTPAVEKRAKETTPAVATPAPAPAPALTPAPAASAATPVPTAPKVAAETAVPEVPAITFEFPSVGLLPEGTTNDMDNAYLAAKFAYGFQHWQATGEALPLF